MKMKKVILKSVPEYEGLYVADNYGNIYNAKTMRKLKLCESHHGYKRIMLFKNGKGKTFAVHRIIATLFVDNPHNFSEVNHKSENTSDNSAENLEWCTRKYNINYGNRLDKFMMKTVQKDLSGNIIAEYKSQAEASKQTGISQGSISNACSGRCKTAGGYIWYCERLLKEIGNEQT